MTGAGGTAWLSIGALARATGVPVETLRTWESRYGFPRPERKPSGHRLYPTAAVPRLRRIAQALALGHRAGQVVGATDGVLDELLRAVSPAPGRGAAAAASPPVTAADQASLLALVSRFDAAGLHQALVAEWARLGPIELLETRVAPLVREVGDAWERGELEIRHEHFLSERVSDVLAALRLPLEERASGPLVILATLPGEAHGLGLQMAAAALAAAGCRGLLLGTETPVPQLAALARDTGARAVAVSVSRSTAGAATAAPLRRLRAQLPRRVRLVVGGEGAPPGRAGIERLASLRELDAWGRGLALGRPPAV